MATPEQKSKAVGICTHLLDGMAKNLADKLYGPDGPPPNAHFFDLERQAIDLADEARCRFLQILLERQALALDLAPPELLACPTCHRPTDPLPSHPRVLHSTAGTLRWLEPRRRCDRCRRDFFPQSKLLGLAFGSYSDSALELICYSGANKPSFREASADLAKLARLEVKEKQVERLTKAVGCQRVAQREALVNHFAALPLIERKDGAPEGAPVFGPGQVAVVMADAGTLQVRDESFGAKKPAAKKQAAAGEPEPAPQSASAGERCRGHAPTATSAAGGDAKAADAEAGQTKADKGFWREDKVGLVMTMTSETHDADPHPQVPDTFRDPAKVVEIVRGLNKSGMPQPGTFQSGGEAEPAGGDEAGHTRDNADGYPEGQVDEDVGGGPPPGGPSEAAEAADADAAYKGPKLRSRRVVASRQAWPLFGVTLAATAWLLGQARAARKAFVADGASGIWGVWQERFSSYVPILDFVHVMSYVYSAAKAVGVDAVDKWRLYQQWIGWTWQGKVSLVVEQLRAWQLENGKASKGDVSGERAEVARALGYLEGNQDKMKYDEYRMQGLPIVSSLAESMVKQISRRVKGTEKFWRDEGAEAILQLRADYLSDGDVMGEFWQRRQSEATGQRSYKPRS